MNPEPEPEPQYDPDLVAGVLRLFGVDLEDVVELDIRLKPGLLYEVTKRVREADGTVTAKRLRVAKDPAE